MTTNAMPIGDHLREWRRRRRLSQLDLACEAEISTRHLSFVETGRAAPSREMVLRLAEQLEVPLRDRNAMLLAAGFAPAFAERPLSDPGLRPAREAIDAVLAAHEPYPALAVDRHWSLVAHNRGVALLIAGASAALLKPPVNVLRLSLHPDGLAPVIANLPEWRAHLLARLRREAERGGDPVLADLHRELSGYKLPPHAPAGSAADGAGLAIPFRLMTAAGPLCFLSTTMVFGTPTDVTLSELAIETFLPADATTAATLRRMLPAA